MKRIPWINQWLLAVAAAAAVAGAVLAFVAARPVSARPAVSHRLRNVPVPALDRVLAKLAAEARSRTLATNTRAD
jgi:hypothetical protein